MHDDYLLVEYADSLQRLRWLGAYNNRTLSKGISYSAFIFLCHIFKIPYTLGLILFWVSAGIVFVLL